MIKIGRALNMNKKQNLNIDFDNGIREITISGDPNRIVRWNTTDMNMLERLSELRDYAVNELSEKMVNAYEELGNKVTVDENGDLSDKNGNYSVFSTLDREIRAKIDYTFGAGTSQAFFENVNPLTPRVNNNGEVEFLIEHFVERVLPFIAEHIEDSYKDVLSVHLKNKQKNNSFVPNSRPRNKKKKNNKRRK